MKKATDAPPSRLWVFARDFIIMPAAWWVVWVICSAVTGIHL
jgi:hypothetical protein